MQDINKQINDSKRNSENLEKIVKVQQKLGGPNLVQPHRRLIKEGGMFKQKESIGGFMSDLLRSKLGYESDNIQLYLFNDCLVMARLSSMGDFKFRSMFSLDRVTVKSMEKSGRSNTFVLEISSTHHDEESNFPLTLHKIEDALEWVQVINSTVKSYFERKNTIKLPVAPAKRRASLNVAQAATPSSSVSGYPAGWNSSVFSSDDSTSGPSLSSLEPSTTSVDLNRFNKAIENLESIFRLQSDLYRIPQFVDLQPPPQLSDIQSRIQSLKSSIEQQKTLSADIDRLLRQERAITSFFQLVKEGQKWMDNLTGWIASHYNSNTTEGVAANNVQFYLAEWYRRLCTSWNELTEMAEI